MRQLCEVLAYLHSQQPPVIHRDLKPENVLLDDNDHIMLIDFGIAKASEPATTTRLLARAFTHGFSPPEQVLGVGTEARSDIYSFGATFYYLLTGQVPPAAHERLAGRALDIPSLLVADLAPELDKILISTLSLNIDQRPASVRDLGAMLQVLERRLPSTSSHTAKTSRLDEEAGTTLGVYSWTPFCGIKLPEAESVLSQQVTTELRRKRGFLVGAAVMIIVAVGLLAGVYFLGEKKKAPVVTTAIIVEPTRAAAPADISPMASPLPALQESLPPRDPASAMANSHNQPSGSADVTCRRTPDSCQALCRRTQRRHPIPCGT